MTEILSRKKIAERLEYVEALIADPRYMDDHPDHELRQALQTAKQLAEWLEQADAHGQFIGLDAQKWLHVLLVPGLSGGA